MKFLRVYDKLNNFVAHLINYYDLYLVQEINALDYIQFSVSGFEIGAALLELEGYIETEDEKYVIKEISTDDNNILSVFAIQDVEKLKGVRFSQTSSQQSVKSKNILDYTSIALNGTGWSVNYQTEKTSTEVRNEKRAIDIDSANTPFEAILSYIVPAFDIEVRFDTENKVVLYEDKGKFGKNTGAYFIESVNLSTFAIDKDSNELITKLYPYGKDGVTIAKASKNTSGTTYITNNSYTNKDIVATWVDERYTDADSLYAAAKSRLEELSKPVVSYKLTVADLYNISSDNGNIFEFNLGDTVKIKSKGEETSQRVVKIERNFDNPEATSIELSNKSYNLVITNADRGRLIRDINTTINTNTTIIGGIAGTVEGIGEIINQQNQKIEDLTFEIENIKQENNYTDSFVNDNILTSNLEILNLRIGDYVIKQIKKDKYDIQEYGNFFDNGWWNFHNADGSLISALYFDSSDEIQEVPIRERFEGSEAIYSLTNPLNETASFSLSIPKNFTSSTTPIYEIESSVDEIRDRMYFSGVFLLDSPDKISYPNIIVRVNGKKFTSTFTPSDNFERVGSAFTYAGFTNNLYEIPYGTYNYDMSASASLLVTLKPNETLYFFGLHFYHCAIASDIDFEDTRTFNFIFQPIEITEVDN